MRTKQQLRILRQAIIDIDEVIAKVHSTRMDFGKGSIEQNLINELDGARVTTRAIIRTKENRNANTVHPQT